MYVIGIIGAGQLGTRHLQSLARLKGPVTIYVADINKTSLEIAESRFNEMNSAYQVHYAETSAAFPKELDVVIVATNSQIRLAVVEQLLKDHVVRHLILEKFLFPKEADFEAASTLFAQFPAMKVWVNCPRRIFDLYKGIAATIKDQGAVHISVIGSQWGLGCNSIHFVDVFSLLVADRPVEVLATQIDDEYIPSKRPGYIEFSGSIYLTANGGHHMEVVSFKNGNHPVVVTISTAQARWTINETAGTVEYMSVSNNWQVEGNTIRFPYQSQFGADVIAMLLEAGHCDLTPYPVSALLHQRLLAAFLEKYSTITKVKETVCPIT